MDNLVNFINEDQDEDEIMWREIEEAFHEDCDALLNKFAMLSLYDINAFIQVWREYSFPLVYAGNSELEPLQMITTLMFRVAKSYIKKSTNKYMQIGGLYLLYGLYHRQPIPELVKIHIVPDEYTLIDRITLEAAQQSAFHPRVVFNKLLHDNAFMFSLFHGEFAFKYDNDYLRSMLINDVSQLKPEFGDEVRVNYDSELKLTAAKPLRELKRTEDAYKQALEEFVRDNDDLIEMTPMELCEPFKLIRDGDMDVKEPEETLFSLIKGKASTSVTNEYWRTSGSVKKSDK